MGEKFVYLFTAPAGWDRFAIKYRRHRLAEYLANCEDTEAVIWVYAIKATPRIPESYRRAKEEMAAKLLAGTNAEGITEFPLPDFLPGRYMRFKAACGHPAFRALKELLESYRGQKVLWFTYPVFPYLTGLLSWDLTCYDCSDLWSEPIEGFRPRDFSSLFFDRLIGAAEKEILCNSKVVFASSDYLAAHIYKHTAIEAEIVENGVDLEQMPGKIIKQPELYKKVAPPRLGYVGSMKRKIDIELLAELAAGNPSWNLILIGPGFLEQDASFRRLIEKDNVHYTGEVGKEELSSYMDGLTLGLLPYRDIPYNRASFPLKFYEYLAHGKPVVGCNVPATARYQEDGVYLHVKRSQFETACREALSFTEAQEKEKVARRIEIARHANWSDKLAYMAGRVKDALSSKKSQFEAAPCLQQNRHERTVD